MRFFPHACCHCVFLPQELCMGFNLPPLTTLHSMQPSPVLAPPPTLSLHSVCLIHHINLHHCKLLVTFLLSICFPTGTGDPRAPWHEQSLLLNLSGSLPLGLFLFHSCISPELSLLCAFLCCLCLRRRVGIVEPWGDTEPMASKVLQGERGREAACPQVSVGSHPHCGLSLCGPLGLLPAFLEGKLASQEYVVGSS